MIRALAIVTACVACVATSSARPKDDARPSAGAADAGVDGAGPSGAASGGALGTVGTIGTIGTSNARFCDDTAPAVPSSAPVAVAGAIRALIMMDARALASHVRPHLQARLERAMFLHAAEAAPFTDTPLDPITAAPGEVHRVLADARGCPTPVAIVTDELRIDFPPAFEETRAENAAEIDATHDELYAGTSITLYCGSCGVAALVIESPLDEKRGAVVLAWDDLRGGMAPNQ